MKGESCQLPKYWFSFLKMTPLKLPFYNIKVPYFLVQNYEVTRWERACKKGYTRVGSVENLHPMVWVNCYQNQIPPSNQFWTYFQNKWAQMYLDGKTNGWCVFLLTKRSCTYCGSLTNFLFLSKYLILSLAIDSQHESPHSLGSMHVQLEQFFSFFFFVREHINLYNMLHYQSWTYLHSNAISLSPSYTI